MKGKFLAHRTVAPRLSELLSETFTLLKKVYPDIRNFAVLIHDDGEEIKTRVMPLTDNEMGELYEASDDKVRYVAHTDENSNFIKGEEK